MMPFLQAEAPVVENVHLARDTYRLRIRCQAIAEHIRPGQFVMLRVPKRDEPLLGRAFALYDTVLDGGAGVPACLDIVYLVVGRMTGLMATLKAGYHVEVWGPLGNGFPDYSGIEHLVLVAGGIGQTPFPALIHRVLGNKGYGDQPARREVQRVSVYYGVRTADLFAGLEGFEAAGAEIHLATDDGSRGFHGFVTQLLERSAAVPAAVAEKKEAGGTPALHWVGCGPEPMMHALAELAQRRSIFCDVSLETPMACGIGICFSCVAKIRTDQSALTTHSSSAWDYRRVCVEGPVFDAAKIIW